MLRVLLAFAILFFAVVTGILPVRAEWKDKNDQINQTNFIIMARGSPICSATLISVKFKLVITANHCMGDFIDTKTVSETNESGEVKDVVREVLDDVPLAQKSYQGFQLVGDASYMSQIVAHEPKVDMTLLKIRADKISQTIFSHVLTADRKVERGDRVWVVGNPLGMLDASLTSGVVSSTTRMYRTPWAENEEVPFIQTDAAINGGNSGGALYNDDGEFIGIPDAGWRGANGLGLTLTPESIRAFLKRNCYAEVYDEKLTRHACIQERRDVENKKREKKGLPPLKDDEGPQE